MFELGSDDIETQDMTPEVTVEEETPPAGGEVTDPFFTQEMDAPEAVAAPVVDMEVEEKEDPVPQAEEAAPASAPETPPEQSTAIEEPVAPPAVSTGELEKAISAKIEDAVRSVLGPAVDETARKIVEDIAWEVIPDLAEAMIKSEIERIKAEHT